MKSRMQAFLQVAITGLILSLFACDLNPSTMFLLAALIQDHFPVTAVSI